MSVSPGLSAPAPHAVLRSGRVSCLLECGRHQYSVVSHYYYCPCCLKTFAVKNNSRLLHSTVWSRLSCDLAIPKLQLTDWPTGIILKRNRTEETWWLYWEICLNKAQEEMGRWGQGKKHPTKETGKCVQVTCLLRRLLCKPQRGLSTGFPTKGNQPQAAHCTAPKSGGLALNWPRVKILFYFNNFLQDTIN